MLVVAVGDYRPVFYLLFDFIFYVLDSIENVFSHTCVLPNIKCILAWNLAVWDIYLCWL